METNIRNKCKAYTSLEQSKKLAEFLPLESSDMWWSRCTITDFGDGVLKVSYAVEPCNISQFRNTKEDIPCWSLAALFSVIPKHIKDYNVLRIDMNEDTFAIWYDEIGFGVNAELPYITNESTVDACYELILKLNELNLL